MIEQKDRIMELARPKFSKAVWETIEPPIIWGNQEPMKPLNKASLRAKATHRVSDLATPKQNFQLDHPQKCSRHYYLHSCGRSSVIWNVSPVAMQTQTSRRIEQLATPKQIHSEYKEDRPNYVLDCGRSSPILDVSEAARKASERSRTKTLALPKITHKDYQPPRTVQWIVSHDAQEAVPTDRLEQLAVPKNRKDGSFRNPEWVVSRSARNAKANGRLHELAKPKQLTESYRPNLDIEELKVPVAALKAKLTERIDALATPIIRDTMDHVQFDPLAFRVKESALKGKVPDRIYDLSRPIVRSGPKAVKK